MTKAYFINNLLELRTLNDDQTDDYGALIATIFESTDLSPEEKLQVFSNGFLDELKSGNYDWLESLRWYFEKTVLLCDLSNCILVDKIFENIAENTYEKLITRILNKAIRETEFKDRLFIEFNNVIDFDKHLLFLKSLKLIIEFKPKQSKIALELVEHLKIKDLLNKIENLNEE